METLELEISLLTRNSISKQEIRSELSSETDGWNTEEEFESMVQDRFNMYKKLVETFNNRVFTYDDKSRTVKIKVDFLAKQEYTLCLAKMYQPTKIEGERYSYLFEKIVAEALKNYLGDGAQYKLIDQNKDTLNFEDFCKTEIYEKPHPEANENFRRSDKITPSTDIIVWKPIDNHSGKIILLVQCKLSKHWKHGTPVNIETWKSQLINFGMEPVRVFAIADILEKEDYVNLSKNKGLILDRPRVIALLAKVENDELNQIRKEIGTLELEEILEA